MPLIDDLDIAARHMIKRGMASIVAASLHRINDMNIIDVNGALLANASKRAASTSRGAVAINLRVDNVARAS